MYARLRALAPNPTNAVASLKLSLRSYIASEMGPRDLISNIWNILDRDLDNTASVVNLVIDLLEGEDKKNALLGAWNGFKIEVSSATASYNRWLANTCHSNVVSSLIWYRLPLAKSGQESRVAVCSQDQRLAHHPTHTRQLSGIVWRRLRPAPHLVQPRATYQEPHRRHLNVQHRRLQAHLRFQLLCLLAHRRRKPLLTVRPTARRPHGPHQPLAHRLRPLPVVHHHLRL